jgi:hypothetical protein
MLSVQSSAPSDCAYLTVKAKMTVVAVDAQLRTAIRKVGGADRDRTDDLMLAKHALSQLSYSPEEMVGLDRVELSTSPLSGVRSSQLSYRPG